MFDRQMVELRERVQEARHVNDFFCRILDHDSAIEEVYESLNIISSVEPSLLVLLKTSDRLSAVRTAESSPSEKIIAFLDFLQDDAGLNLKKQESIKGCLEALKAREDIGTVNALLVKSNGEGTLVVPLHIVVQPGSGQVRSAIHDNEDFRKSVERAYFALCGRGFLKSLDDIIFSLDLTDPHYLGSSIGLAAAVGMYGARRRLMIDPYTAFTGDINLHQGQWKVRGVSGVPQKLEAARRSGCRRVFIPQENLQEVNSAEWPPLQLIPVDNLLEVFLKLQTPLQPLSGDSLQVRKINVLQVFCLEQGWDLSSACSIQNGLQFRVAPALLPAIVVNVYDSGTHTPKQHDRQEYRDLLNALQAQEESRIPIRKIEQKFNIQDLALCTKIREALEQLQPVEQRQEPYCEYVFRFERGQERLTIKQFQKGTLHIQGSAGELYKAILECIVPRYLLQYPNAQLSVESLLLSKEGTDVAVATLSVAGPSLQEIPLPYIGTDESGKGDYFGPMVVAAVLIDSQTKSKLEALGVKDSKLLSDKRCRELAMQIRNICQGKFHEVEILPERYNELYEDFRKEGQNLNHLLAWGHARAIESLLDRFPCSHAVADQFGDEHYIRSRLMEKGRQLQLIQLPKGERYLAVAAASILSRDKFLTRIEKLSQEYGLELPKGASETVITAAKQVVEKKGSEELRKVAKLHHKTTRKILEEK